MRSDGSGRLRLEIFAISGAFVPFPRIAQSIAQQWQEIGIQLDVSELERSLGFTRMRNNEHQLFMWANDGSELIYAFPRHALPIDPAEAMMGPLIANWFATNGEEGMEPTDENMLKAFDLYRSAGGQKRRRATRPPRRSGRSSSTTFSASARSASRRRSWVSASSRTRWATSRRARSTCSTRARRRARTRRRSTSRTQGDR